MDQMNQENAALVEEATASSMSMGEEAKNLNQMMSFFNISKKPSAVLATENQTVESADVPLVRTAS